MPAVAEQVRVPEFRFPGFTAAWSARRLGDLGKTRNGLTYTPNDVCDSDAGILVARSSNIQDGRVCFDDCVYVSMEVPTVSILGKGDLLICVRNGSRQLIGKKLLIDERLAGSAFGAFMAVFESDCGQFVNQLLSTSGFSRQIQANLGATINQITNRNLLGFKFMCPESHSEQEKIAGFFTAVDERIGKLKRKKELLEEYKRGMMQKLFSQEVRFKDEHGRHYPDWEELKLCDVAKKSNLKNKENEELPVLTNSATRGIVAQDSYFDREITTDSNLDGYYIVKEGAFVYNPRISKPAPAGPINRNEVMLGLMSPLYTVFHVDGGVADFLALYFKSTLWFRYIMAVSNIGARHDRMNVSVDDFFRMPTPMPSAPERAKIAEFLTGLDDKLANLGRRIEKAEEFKRGLLQKMFV